MTEQARLQWPSQPGEMAERIRRYDWSTTALGPKSRWPQSLCSAIDIMLDVPFASCVWWGPELVQLCNDGVAAMLASPRADVLLGQRAAEFWRDDWHGVGKLVASVLATGEPVLRAGTDIPHFDGAHGLRRAVWYVALRDDGGRIAGVMVTAIDAASAARIIDESASGQVVTPREQDQQRILFEAVRHRLRNTLAMMRAIVRRTAGNSASVEDFAAHLEGRIDAYARIQAAAIRNGDTGIDLLGLVSEELRAYRNRPGNAVTVEGPLLRLAAEPAETFGLAIHELAVNSVKFGALAHPTGRLRVEWSIEPTADGDMLDFRWMESGVEAPLPPPGRRGFGTEVLERSLANELDARTELSYTPAGLACRILMPAEAILARRALGLSPSFP